MHAVLPLLPYREPEILDSVERVTPLCNSLHISSVLLVTDAGLRGAGATDKLEALLREAGIRCAVYDQTRANPRSRMWSRRGRFTSMKSARH